jgi:hypothetical protein
MFSSTSVRAWLRSGAVQTALIFAVLLGVFAASPVATSYDSRWSLHTALSFAKGQGGDLTDDLPILQQEKHYAIEYRDGRPRTIYPIGASLVAMPAVALIALVSPDWARRLSTTVHEKTEKFIASMIGAAAGAIFFWVMVCQFQSRAVALAATAIFAFSTSMWSTATRALWQHGPLVLTLVIAMLLLLKARRRAELVQYAAIPLAFSYLMRPTAIVPIVVLSAYVLVYYRPWFLRYVFWALLIAIPWIAFNIHIYGNLLPPYYSSNAFSPNTRFVEGLLGNLFSPSRGLFVFSPVLLLSLSGFVLALRDSSQRALHVAFAVIILGHFVIVGEASMWWAGHCFGPRFTTDIAPFLTYFAAFNLRVPAEFGRAARVAGRTAVVVLAIVSAAIHSQGALRGVTLRWNVEPSNIDQNPSRAWDWRDPQFLHGIRESMAR